MFDKDQKSIYVLAEKVMTGDPGRGGSDRHRLPPFASDIVGDKKITFRKDPDGLGAKTIIMYRTFTLRRIPLNRETSRTSKFTPN